MNLTVAIAAFVISALAIIVSVCNVRTSRAIHLRVKARLRQIEAEDGLPDGWLDSHPYPQSAAELPNPHEWKYGRT